MTNHKFQSTRKNFKKIKEKNRFVSALWTEW